MLLLSYPFFDRLLHDCLMTESSGHLCRGQLSYRCGTYCSSGWWGVTSRLQGHALCLGWVTSLGQEGATGHPDPCSSVVNPALTQACALICFFTQIWYSISGSLSVLIISCSWKYEKKEPSISCISQIINSPIQWLTFDYIYSDEVYMK